VGGAAHWARDRETATCWVVERTFAWLGKYRRLSKDYEFLPQSSETMIYLAMIRLMLERLDKIAQKAPL
jgi:transposase